MFAQTIPCAWNSVPLHQTIEFAPNTFGNSNSGAFTVEGFQLLTACSMSGTFTVDVTTADASSTNTYAFALYYNSGGQGTAGALYTTTGQFTGAQHFKTVNSGVNIPAVTTAKCASYPCTLPAGMYAIAFATNCVSPCAYLGGENTATNYVSFAVKETSGYSSGFPSSITPLSVSPVLFSSIPGESISVLIW